MDDHYATLQVTCEASPAVIRAAYRALSQQYHPDKNPDNPDAEAFLKSLNVAYAILSDPAQRRAYDAQRQAAAASTAAPAPANSATATEAAAHAATLPADAFTGTVNGHTFTLQWYPAQVLANTVWTETFTTAARGGVAVYSTPRQQLGFRPETGQDFFVEYAGHPIPVALGQAVVLIAAQGGRLQRAQWVALWNRQTGYWYWFGHTEQSIGRKIRPGAAAVRDFLGAVMQFALVAALLAIPLWRYFPRDWLLRIPYCLFVLPGALGLALGLTSGRSTRTADEIGTAIRHKITALLNSW